MTYTVERLPGNSVVEARVRTVKLSGQGVVGKGNNLFSPFVEVKHRTLQVTNQPTTQDEEITEPLEDEEVKKNCNEQSIFIHFGVVDFVSDGIPDYYHWKLANIKHLETHQNIIC